MSVALLPAPGTKRNRSRAAGNYRAWALPVVALFVVGCQREDPIDLLAEGERLCLEALWSEAIPVLKEHLLAHPDDGGAHFYLGRCYMMAKRESFRPAMAMGEFQTALALFHRAGKSSPISRFADEYFEYISNLEMAKVRIYEVQSLRSFGARLWQLQELIQQSRTYLEVARQIRPDDPDVEGISEVIRGLERSNRRGPPTKTPR